MSDYSSCTREDILEILRYDAMTGTFHWLNNPKVGRNVRGKAAGCITNKNYLTIRTRYGAILAHRLVWLVEHGRLPEDQLDHINGIRSDNRISNLREVSNRENSQNISKKQAKGVTGLLGVTYTPRTGHGNPSIRKYAANITINGNNIGLGRHLTPEDAHDAYLKAKAELHPFSSRIDDTPSPKADFPVYVYQMNTSPITSVEYRSINEAALSLEVPVSYIISHMNVNHVTSDGFVFRSYQVDIKKVTFRTSGLASKAYGLNQFRIKKAAERGELLDNILFDIDPTLALGPYIRGPYNVRHDDVIKTFKTMNKVADYIGVSQSAVAFLVDTGRPIKERFWVDRVTPAGIRFS
jgi:uncharacterized protein (DUF433 family)